MSNVESQTPSIDLGTSASRPIPTFQDRVTIGLTEFPWWTLVVLFGAVVLIFNFATNDIYRNVYENLVVGIQLTILVTVVAYVFAIVLGLVTALGQLSDNLLFRNAAVLYVQVVRGIPIIVQIFTVALVIVPLFIEVLNGLGAWLASQGILPAENLFTAVTIRDVNFIIRGIVALALSYGAFSSEIFRAGIQSIDRGQLDAASALGLNRIQSLRLIILPQAVRRVLPPLGNDFIAMLKESSLVSVLGVNEITQLAKKHAASTFRYPETYYTLAFLYLSMTLVLAMGVKYMERRLKSG